MSDLGQRLMSTPYDDPYWDTQGQLNGKRIVGHKLNDEEFSEYSCSLWCFVPWKMDWENRVVWRYQGE